MSSYSDQLVFVVAEKVFLGRLPDDPDITVGAIVATLLKDANPEAVNFIIPQLYVAVHKYQAMQDAAPV
jgi:hypothetical protein